MNQFRRHREQLDRRQLLIVSGGAALGLATIPAIAGCSGSGQPPKPSPSHRPSPTPQPLPGTVPAAKTETELAAFATAILSAFDDDLDPAVRQLVKLIARAHRAHAAVLLSATPFDLPVSGAKASPSPSPSPTPSRTATPKDETPSASPTPKIGSSAPKSLHRLRSLELDAADDHRRRALGTIDPGPDDQQELLRLLWGSLAVAASSYAQVLSTGIDPGAEPPVDHRVAVAMPTSLVALQHLVAQCYPVIFGYQTALAVLSGDDADHARDRLSAHRELRDRLSSALHDQDGEVPNPHPAYRLPVQPSTATRARNLLGTMEDRLLPFLGQWLATADTDRTAALDALTAGANDVGRWSAGVRVWPGWPVEA